MSTSAVGNLSSSYLQQVLISALQIAGITTNTGPAQTSGTGSSSQSDSNQLSPFAQLAGALQQLQESDPTKYKQVTAQVATNLQSAAQTANSQGNTAAAAQLTQLATDFTSASQSGALPNLQDLAQAIGGASGAGHHHHHHAHASSSSDSSTSTTSSSTSSSTDAASEDSSLDPTSIILQTLAQAGVSTSSNS